MNRRTGTPIAPDEYGDYDSPVLRQLRDVWNRFLEEQASEDDVLAAIGTARTTVDAHINQLQAQIDTNVSNHQAPLFQVIAKSFMEHLHALDLMGKEFELPPDDPEYDDFFERGYQLAQEATNRMMRAHEETMVEIQKEQWRHCPSCGARNLAENNECHTCRTVLPHALEMVSRRGRQAFVAEEVRLDFEGVGRLTQNFLTIKSAVDEWLAGTRVSSGVFEVLAAVEENLLVHLSENDRLLESTECETVRDALEQTAEKVEEFQTSLSRLRRALSESQPKTAVVRIRMVELETLSGDVVESYYGLKRAFEA